MIMTMDNISFYFIILFIFYFKGILCCLHLELSSDVLGNVKFRQLSLDEHKQKLVDYNNNINDQYYQYKDSGRATYISEIKPYIYLYHTQINDIHNYQSTNGRWIISEALFSKESAMAYINSWSVTPYLIKSIPDVNSQWFIPSSNVLNHWEIDNSLDIVCSGYEDETIYFESSVNYQPKLTGFYIQRYDMISRNKNEFYDIFNVIVDNNHPYISMNDDDKTTVILVYSQIKQFTNDIQMYLYQLPYLDPEKPDTWGWIIGKEYGIDAGLAVIFTPETFNSIKYPRFINNNNWKFIPENHKDGTSWLFDIGKIFSATTKLETIDNTYYKQVSSASSSSSSSSSSNEDSTRDHLQQIQAKYYFITNNIYQTLFYSRTLKQLSSKEQIGNVLRNKIVMPQIGLGTGGIPHDKAIEVFINAYLIGYRLFDLAREYGNEKLISRALLEENEFKSSHSYRTYHQPMNTTQKIIIRKPPQRNELFFVTKVWPTELGFEPTTNAIYKSLKDLKTNYIDLYLLHWPKCDASISWMHCEDVIDHRGTWKESWIAFEKAYAEGRILSIGVSNFNIELLQEMNQIATTLPHVIQNWSELGHLDLDVRSYCKNHTSIYQPYASLRNIKHHLSITTSNILERLAKKYHVSISMIILKFYIQTNGISIIPRSTQEIHLIENLSTHKFELAHEEMHELGWNY